MIVTRAPRTDEMARVMDGQVTAEDVSVVICAYTEQRWSRLVEAIESVGAQSVRPRELVVVVDHNPALLARLAERFRADPLVTLLESRGARGLSGARNTGVQHSTGEIIAFLDDDATARPDWLEHLRQAFEDPEVQAVGGFAAPDWGGTPPAWFPPEFLWVVGCTYRGAPHERVEIRNPIGCNMAIRRSGYQLTSGFVEDVGRIGSHLLGCEETLLSIEIRQKRPTARIVFEPDAAVDHHVATDRHRPRYLLRRCFGEGLSKAMVARRVGTADGLASERSYVTSTLPRGVVDGVLESLRTRRSAGLRRSLMILAGLAATVAGYVVGTIRR